MITLHLEAESLEELRTAACNALDLMIPNAKVDQFMREVTGDEKAPAKAFREALAGKSKEARDKRVAENIAKSNEVLEASKPGKKAKAPEPEPEPQRMDEAYEAEKTARLDAMADRAPEEDEVDAVGTTIKGVPDQTNGLKKALADEALKKETIAQLGALFAAGKVKVVRSALDKYGKGAKSFPEIDASQFPAIAEALKRGDIA